RRFRLTLYRVKAPPRRVGCRAQGAKLLRCRVTLRSRGRVIGHGERLHRGARAFTVRIVLTPRGSRLVRHGLRRATVVAVATDTAGRTRRARIRLRIR
ncbi:MAG: hypothetical protein QOI80_1945, partial [Solirubrobacteraceae bacterium]|nr:hypothetical protein [Solirubrobacteraceae bacterium]